MMLKTAEPIPLRVIDLRGAHPRVAPSSVLADPSGRRARRLRIAGRAVASLFLLWLCGLVLAGLGLLPVSDVPLAGAIRVAEEPAQPSRLATPLPPSRADMRPARPLPSAGAAVHGAQGGAGAHGAPAHAGSGAGARHGRLRDGTIARGRPSTRGTHTSSAPHATPTASHTGQPSTATPTSSSSGTKTKTGRGRGHTTASPGAGGRGRSTSTHGASGSAPGHDPKRPTGHGSTSG
jgi:hypothetical protein